MRPAGAAGVLLLAAACALGGCTYTAITGLATSPDGRRLTATGVRFRYVGLGWDVDRALEWDCRRGPDGRLACRAIEQHLPRPAD